MTADHLAAGLTRAIILAQNHILNGMLKARTKDIKAAEIHKKSVRTELDPVKETCRDKKKELGVHVALLMMHVENLEQQYTRLETEIEVQRKAKEALSRI